MCPWLHPSHILTESGAASVKKCYSEALLGSCGGSYRSVEADPKGNCQWCLWQWWVCGDFGGNLGSVKSHVQ